MDIWLLCYDIGCDKRRLKLSKWLLRFGSRVQESVFELQLKNEAHFNRMWKGVHALADASDTVRAYPITQQALQSARIFGTGQAPERARYAIVL